MSPMSFMSTFFISKVRYASALLAFSSGVSCTMALRPFLCCLISWRSKRLEAFEVVWRVNLASPGGFGRRWQPNRSVDFGPMILDSVLFQCPFGSSHIFLRVCVSMLLMYIMFVFLGDGLGVVRLLFTSFHSDGFGTSDFLGGWFVVGLVVVCGGG